MLSVSIGYSQTEFATFIPLGAQSTHNNLVGILLLYRLDKNTYLQQHTNLGFDRMKSSNGNGTELQPDQKYNKLSSSSFQFGLPTVAEVPLSKLKPVQAVLTPSHRKSRSYLHDPNKPFMVLIPELQEMEKELRDNSADSLNDSGWSFHTANDHDSLLDFDMTADDVGSDGRY